MEIEKNGDRKKLRKKKIEKSRNKERKKERRKKERNILTHSCLEDNSQFPLALSFYFYVPFSL